MMPPVLETPDYIMYRWLDTPMPYHPPYTYQNYIEDLMGQILAYLRKHHIELMVTEDQLYEELVCLLYNQTIHRK